jgi:uncharacterized membrane protein
MRELDRTPEQLATELLGRNFSELDPEEQRVLQRISSGTITGPDASEVAAAHATYGERMADRVAAWGGSWYFILAFALVLFLWVLINSGILTLLGLPTFDRYPFILLNLVLSTLAAIQAPVILMSQNRQSQKDRIAARHDYEVNLRAQLEIIRLHRRLDDIFDRLSSLDVRAEPDKPAP